MKVKSRCRMLFMLPFMRARSRCIIPFMLLMTSPGTIIAWCRPTLRCNYHQNIGHNTEEYTKVRDLIEELIQSGSLTHFIQRSWSHANREGSRNFGARGGRGGRFNGNRGRGRGCVELEEERTREPRVEVRNGCTQQNPNTIAGSVNMVEF